MLASLFGARDADAHEARVAVRRSPRNFPISSEVATEEPLHLLELRQGTVPPSFLGLNCKDFSSFCIARCFCPAQARVAFDLRCRSSQNFGRAADQADWISGTDKTVKETEALGQTSQDPPQAGARVRALRKVSARGGPPRAPAASFRALSDAASRSAQDVVIRAGRVIRRDCLSLRRNWHCPGGNASAHRGVPCRAARCRPSASFAAA